MTIMKKSFVSILSILAVAASVQAANVTAKISNIHLCCKACVTGAEKAVAKVAGVTAKVDQDAGTVELTGADAKTVQKATDSLVAAGYFGASTDAGAKLEDHTGAKGQKVQTLKVANVHLCCGKCVKTVDTALKGVAGVKAHTAEKNAKTFEITGDFNDKDVFSALHKAGLTGEIAK